MLAVLIGVRLVDFVKREINLPVSIISLLTDSQCVLSWLSTSKALSVFVENPTETHTVLYEAKLLSDKMEVVLRTLSSLVLMLLHFLLID